MNADVSSSHQVRADRATPRETAPTAMALDGGIPVEESAQLEAEALLLLARTGQTARDLARLHRIVGDARFAWSVLWSLARVSEIGPLIARRLAITPWPTGLPPQVLREAAAVRIAILSRNLALHAELRTIGNRLTREGIPVVALKGTALTLRLYDALDGRQCGDIDILVPESRLDQARGILRAMGYRTASGEGGQLEHHSFHGAPWVRHGDALSFVVELHWGLDNPRFVRVDYQRLWRRVLDHDDLGTPYLQLPGEECLVYLALHFVKNSDGLLRLLADLDRLIRREGAELDWRYVCELAPSWDVAWMLYFALQRASSLFATPVPRGVLQRLEPPAWRRALVAALTPPAAALESPSAVHLRGARFRLAHFAMLTPPRRLRDAYLAYLFSDRYWLQQRRQHGFRGLVTRAVRALSGLWWTVRAVADSCADLIEGRPAPRPDQCGDSYSTLQNPEWVD